MVDNVQQCEQELAEAIRSGSRRRPEQAFGTYFEGNARSCALGAAYEGMYRLPREIGSARPQHLERLFDCLDNTIKHCPEKCRKMLTLGAMIVHLNDDHHWTREQIAAWVAGPERTGTTELPLQPRT